MRTFILVISILYFSPLIAQHTISGSFSPAEDFTWLIAYHLQPGTQGYIADTAITDGEFSMQIPPNAATGTYRLVYGVPQEEYYFDVLYNGKEDIKLEFDAEKGIVFENSDENKLFNSYFIEINAAKQKFIDYYTQKRTDKSAYNKLAENLETLQTSYEESTTGMLLHQFVKANRPYIPSNYEASETYWQHKKDEFFKHLDINNTELQASGFLSDKLTNYVFTPVSMVKTSKTATEKILMENVKTVHEKLQGTKAEYRVHIFQSLWNIAEANELDETADFIYGSYLKNLAQKTQNEELISEIETKKRLQIGAKAPEITWDDNGVAKSLSDMKGADCYIVIFWSSTCPHCLNELPALHKELKNYPSVKVLAVGLEDNAASWEKERAKLNRFEHAIALGKWDSEYANIYDIHRTPTYFILDKDKRFIAKPESDRDIIDFLKK
ncbi:TlpA family protein disulfide reductase [Pareuzebyella sediminis]|uniref:TlpA family protein disulfide reductase n=1 Tax=Pareuzebyella sediminis TaxID=2607998 RepID=UPI0011EBDF13|nr:TlpA disulfide reductase family protein [Pareuzebyella sediminis]